MNFESRTIRPFRELEKTQQLLREHAVIVSTDGSEPVHVDGTLILDPTSFTSAGLTLRLAPDKQTLATIRGAFHDERSRVVGRDTPLSLAVMLRTPRLKYADIAFRQRLHSANSIPHHIELAVPGGTTRWRPLRTARGGCTVSMLIVVDEEQERRPLLAWRKGSWLAEVGFRVKSHIHDSGFQPRVLDDVARARFGLGDGVQQFCTLTDGARSIAHALTLDSVLEFYVDESTLRFITAAPRAPAAVQLQIRFVLDAVARFVSEAVHDEDLADYDGGSEWSDTVIDGLARLAVGKRNPTSEELQNSVGELQRDPARFVARLENEWNLRGATAAALDELS